MVATPPQATPPSITQVTISSERLLGVAHEFLAELERLLRPDDWLAPDSVHDIRVLSKRLRAWWRLWCRTDLKPQTQQANQQLRQLSMRLSELRDAQVLAQHGRTLTQLWQGDAEFSRVAPLLQRWVESLDAPLSMQLPDRALMVRLVDRQRALLLDSPWPLELALAPVLVAGYKEIQAAAEQAFVGAESEAFHYWRKRVKVLYYQGEMLNLVGYDITQEQQPILKQLASQLGDLHDLDNLLQRCSRCSSADMMAPEQTALTDALLHYQQRLRGDVADLYRSYRFAEEVD